MDARVKQLVNMIEDAQPVAVAVLAKRLEVSERAVRNYIHRANDSLAGVARIVGSKGPYGHRPKVQTDTSSGRQVQMSLLAC